jgi:hypothetical protein
MSRLLALLAAGIVVCWGAVPTAQTDLDAFMKQVLERRDDNWRKLQQYVLDERETVDVRGPSGAPLWGDRREYTWYLRDGFFVRSPLSANGVTIGESDRRKYEADFLRRTKERDRRAAERAAGGTGSTDAAPVDAAPADIDSLIRQTRQPDFISSAYFLRFKFDEGRYALVGRETLEERDVLRIEYYPRKLFAPERERRRSRDGRCAGVCDDEAYAAELRRLMNKASRVTLWIEPGSHQILKYTFDDLGWDFLPGQWLVRLGSVRASMTMGQPFPEVWLPRTLDMHIALTLAIGDVNVRYALEYADYRRAEVNTRIGIPEPR